MSRDKPLTKEMRSDISRILATDGLSGFTKEQQDRVRQISLDDYEKDLKKNIWLSEQSRNNSNFNYEKADALHGGGSISEKYR